MKRVYLSGAKKREAKRKKENEAKQISGKKVNWLSSASSVDAGTVQGMSKGTNIILIYKYSINYFLCRILRTRTKYISLR